MWNVIKIALAGAENQIRVVWNVQTTGAAVRKTAKCRCSHPGTRGRPCTRGRQLQISTHFLDTWECLRLSLGAYFQFRHFWRMMLTSWLNDFCLSPSWKAGLEVTWIWQWLITTCLDQTDNHGIMGAARVNTPSCLCVWKARQSWKVPLRHTLCSHPPIFAFLPCEWQVWSYSRLVLDLLAWERRSMSRIQRGQYIAELWALTCSSELSLPLGLLT